MEKRLVPAGRRLDQRICDHGDGHLRAARFAFQRLADCHGRLIREDLLPAARCGRELLVLAAYWVK